MVEEEIIDLTVYICSDGTVLSYNKNDTLNILFTDLTSWSVLHKIYTISILPIKGRKGVKKEENVRYVKFYFKNTKTNEVVEIPREHIKTIIHSIKQ